MKSFDIERPHVIHLGADDALAARLQGAARSRGMSVISLELGGLPNRASLVAYLTKAFMFPHRISGLDAAVDLISDLEWFGNNRGYLLVVRGLTDPSDAGNAFASILPNIVDRWRSGEVPFVVAIDGSGMALQAVLADANAEMGRAGALPWARAGTGPVDVVVHSRES